MNESTEKKQVSTKENPIPTGRGGWRGGVKPAVPTNRKASARSVTLMPDEWEALEQHAERLGVRTVTQLMAQLMRQYIHQNAGKIAPIEK